MTPIAVTNNEPMAFAVKSNCYSGTCLQKQILIRREVGV
jgi:hypothetical protein